MNKFDKSKQYQQFRRSSDIEVSKAFVTKLESLETEVAALKAK